MEVKKVSADFLMRWIEGANAAFKNRRNDRIPYEPITLSAVVNEDRMRFACFDDAGTMIGGFSFKYDSGLQVAIIGHVWVLPEKQRHGISDYMLEFIVEYAKKAHINSIQLNVANIYKPAVNLYKKHGFKPSKIYANTPGTYYFIQMTKSICPSNGLDDLKRIMAFLKSKMIFHFLFQADSSPALGYKIYKLVKK